MDYREGLWTVGIVNAGLGIFALISGVLGTWVFIIIGGLLLAFGIFSIAMAEKNYQWD